MEYVTEAMDPSNQKELAKALLQERANIKDFICQVHKYEVQGYAHSKAIRTSDG